MNPPVNSDQGPSDPPSPYLDFEAMVARIACDVRGARATGADAGTYELREGHVNECPAWRHMTQKEPPIWLCRAKNGCFMGQSEAKLGSSEGAILLPDTKARLPLDAPGVQWQEWETKAWVALEGLRCIEVSNPALTTAVTSTTDGLIDHSDASLDCGDHTVGLKLLPGGKAWERAE